jgi:hypothetical protein
VLDATAPLNRLYDEFPHQFTRVEVPRARTYRTVLVYAARCTYTGKGGVTEHADEIAPATLKAVRDEYGDGAKDRRVLVVTHLDVEPFVEKWASSFQFKELAVTHWNAIDGRNDWSEFNTVVVVSLPYRDDAVALNAYQAAHGALGTSSLRTPPENVTALRVSQIIVDVTQAVNRARCRRVVDAEGRCLPTDIFIRLPAERNRQGRVSAEAILEGLREAMPGAAVVPWAIEEVRVSGRRLQFDRALAAYVKTLAPGERAWAVDVRRRLGISHATWERLMRQAQAPGSMLAAVFEEASVKYMTFPRGRSTMGALVRSDDIARTSAVR